MSGKSSKIHIGKGVLKPGTRPIQVYVDENGEYWLCDSGIDLKDAEARKSSCVAHSDIQMAEGG
jgi:hypothetical protein